MKKTLLSVLISLTAILALSAQDTTFTEVWALYGDTAPAWFTDGSEATAEGGDNSFSGVERGIVYNPSENHVYVSSRFAEDADGDEIPDWGEPHVFIIDPLTGQSTGMDQLLTMGITSDNPESFGGGYPLNNVTVDEAGYIYACNMTLASGPDVVSEGGTSVKAFRVYRWGWELEPPTMIIDYQDGGYRLGDKFSVIGNWDTEAYIYAGAGETTKLLRWKVTAGLVDETPTEITLQDITTAGTSITVAPSRTRNDWIYVSGKGLLPTLFSTEGVNLTTVGLSADQVGDLGLLAGRTITYQGRNYMAMFSGQQSAFVFDITKNGENVTDIDIIGLTPAFGTRFTNAWGEGAVEFGIIDEKLHVFVCGPSNGIACYRIEGIGSTGIQRNLTEAFQVIVYPNPATEYADVQFTLPDGASDAVAVKLYDMSGRFMGITPAAATGGEQIIRVNTSDLASGEYIYQLVYKKEMSTGTLIVK